MEKLTRCANVDGQLGKADEIPSVGTALPHQIGDNDLDDKGTYNFEKLMKFRYPKDFAGVTGSSKDQEGKKGGSSL